MCGHRNPTETVNCSCSFLGPRAALVQSINTSHMAVKQGCRRGNEITWTHQADVGQRLWPSRFCSAQRLGGLSEGSLLPPQTCAAARSSRHIFASICQPDVDSAIRRVSQTQILINAMQLRHAIVPCTRCIRQCLSMIDMLHS